MHALPVIKTSQDEQWWMDGWRLSHRWEMKIRSQILKYMHLDRTYCLLTGKYCSGAFLIHCFVLFCFVLFLTVVTKSVLLNLLRCITKLGVFLEKDALYNKAVVLKAKYCFLSPRTVCIMKYWLCRDLTIIHATYLSRCGLGERSFCAVKIKPNECR